MSSSSDCGSASLRTLACSAVVVEKADRLIDEVAEADADERTNAVDRGVKAETDVNPVANNERAVR